MKKLIIELEYDETKFEDGEEERNFMSVVEHNIDSACLEFKQDPTTTIKHE